MPKHPSNAANPTARPRLLPHRRFPAYAYVPGRHPHPLRDPAGHSHALDVPVATNEPPLGSESFCWGADLFNHGYYWEAHEAWEPLWRAADRRAPLGQLLKGLILVAAAGVKLREGKPAAAARHAGRAATLFRSAAQAQDRLVDAAIGMPLATLAVCAEAAVVGPAPDASDAAHLKPVFDFMLLPALRTDRR